MNFLKIKTDDKLHELVSHGTSAFPMKIYIDHTEDFFHGIIDWHWHDEFELFYISSGTMTVNIGDKCVTLTTGEGMMIGSKMIHRFESNDNAVMPNVLFSP